MTRAAPNAETGRLTKPTHACRLEDIWRLAYIGTSGKHDQQRGPPGPAISKEESTMASEIKQTLQDVRHRLDQIKEYL